MQQWLHWVGVISLAIIAIRLTFINSNLRQEIRYLRDVQENNRDLIEHYRDQAEEYKFNNF